MVFLGKWWKARWLEPLKTRLDTDPEKMPEGTVLHLVEGTD